MDKPKVLGKRLYIEIPQRNSKIIVDENTKEELNRQLMKHLHKVKIWAIGDMCHTSLQEAFEFDKEILVDPAAIARASMVPFDEGGEEPIVRALIYDHDVIHIW